MMTLLFGLTASSLVNARPQEIDSHDVEVVAAGKVLIEQHSGTIRNHGIREEPRPSGPFVERDVVNDANARYAGNGAQAVHKIQMETSPAWTIA
jgi:hypothetical protein